VAVFLTDMYFDILVLCLAGWNAIARFKLM